MEEVKKYLGNWSSATPGLLILLQDGSDKSAELTNKIINRIILNHYAGCRPKDRCFIIILNLQGEVVCNGWLSELYDAPLDIQKKKMMVSDGCGVTVEVDVNISIWIKSSKYDSIYNEVGLLDKIDILTNDWCNDFGTRSTFYNSPILLDIGCNLHSSTEIMKSKAFVFGYNAHKLSSPLIFHYDCPTSWMKEICYKNECEISEDGIFQTENEVLSCLCR